MPTWAPIRFFDGASRADFDHQPGNLCVGVLNAVRPRVNSKYRYVWSALKLTTGPSSQFRPFLRTEVRRSSREVQQTESGPVGKHSFGFRDLNTLRHVRPHCGGRHHHPIRSAVGSVLPFQSLRTTTNRSNQFAPPPHDRRAARRRSKSARTDSTSSGVAGTEVAGWPDSSGSTPVSPSLGVREGPLPKTN
jgi:hypothetical protein